MKATDNQLHGALLTALQDAITEMANAEQEMEADTEAGKAIHPATRNRFYYLKGQVEALDHALELMK